MKILIAGLKAWPLHHEMEHVIGEALIAAGHTVHFLGCAHGAMKGCECFDLAASRAGRSHQEACAQCSRTQVGVHARAGFSEIPMPWDEDLAQKIKLRLAGLDAKSLLDLPCVGLSLREVLAPSLMRYARSGRSPEEALDRAVIHDYALQACMMESLLPGLFASHQVDAVFLLNGLFFAERVITDIARRMGLRVVNYERSHVRNAIVLDDAEPACFLNLHDEPDWRQNTDPLLDVYLQGRRVNRDASTRFGTGPSTAQLQTDNNSRPLVAIFTNVCWDSSVSTRPSAFGGYLPWLEEVIALCGRTPECDFVLRVHPGEARLAYDPTLERTEAWLEERSLPENLRVIPADSDESSYSLIDQAACGLVFVSSIGLEMACQGKAVIVCAGAHYAAQGFTLDATPGTLDDCLRKALDAGLNTDTAQQARAYAGRLFLDEPMPFPWVDEVEYGRPQRVCPPVDAAWLERDQLLTGLVSYIVGKVRRPPSLRMLLEDSSLCPLPFHYMSRLSGNAKRITVLIPAWNRASTLLRSLQAWREQSLDGSQFDVLVVDDGSPVPLEELLSPVFKHGGRLRLKVLRHKENRGPAAARNTGLDWIMQQPEPADLVFITGDDMIPAPDLLENLLAESQAWQDPRLAILARVDWDPRAGSNRVMRLVERNGMQFGFHSLPARARLPENYFYTSGVALSTAWLNDHKLRFSESFPYAAWEDIEFAVRAFRHGLQLAYSNRVQLFHHHPVTYDEFASRQFKAGVCARIFYQQQPNDYVRLVGPPPAAPPDRQLLKHLEEAVAELSKLDLDRLKQLPGSNGDLATQLDREQDNLLTNLLNAHSMLGWFSGFPFTGETVAVDLLSIVVPVFNKWELTAACIEAVRKHTSGKWELILVDNGSTDETASMASCITDIRYIRIEENLGYARANNLGAQAARGHVLVLLNNDTEVQEGWDKPLREALADESVGAAGSRLVYANGTIQHAGLAFGPDHLPWHIYRGFPADSPEVMHARDFNALTGACLALRMQDYRRLGGLDENFINCYEDIDLCLRLRQEGKRIVYRPDSLVVHHEGQSEGRNNRVNHSWFVLKDRWQDRFPCDEDSLLAEDGWELLRSDDGAQLRRLARSEKVSSRELVSQAGRLVSSGFFAEARKMLQDGMRHADNKAMIVDELAALELRAGNLLALDELHRTHGLSDAHRLLTDKLRQRFKDQMSERGISMHDTGEQIT